MKKALILFFALLTSSYGLVLTAQEYRVYLYNTVIKIYQNGELIKTVKKEEKRLHSVYKVDENGNYYVKNHQTGEEWIVNGNCKVIKVLKSKFLKVGAYTCPVDPKIRSMKIVYPISEDYSEELFLKREKDTDDLNGDNETSDIMYEGHKETGEFFIGSISIYDLKTKKLEFIASYTNDKLNNIEVEFSSYVYVEKREGKQKEGKAIPLPSDILTNF